MHIRMEHEACQWKRVLFLAQVHSEVIPPTWKEENQCLLVPRPEAIRAAAISDLAGNLDSLKKGRQDLEVGMGGRSFLIFCLRKSPHAAIEKR